MEKNIDMEKESWYYDIAVHWQKYANEAAGFLVPFSALD